MNADSPFAFEQVVDQHRELKVLLARIETILETRCGSFDEVVALLGGLGDQLVKHFAFEEEGGYFADALRHAPQLINRANQLLAQHPKLRNDVQRIGQEVRATGESEQWWEQTRVLFQELKQELLGHERQENVLLQEAYTLDIGSHD